MLLQSKIREGKYMVYFEYWDRRKQQWCLAKTSIFRFFLIKMFNDNEEISDIKRVPKKEIIFK
jgi:hypothetical protein